MPGQITDCFVAATPAQADDYFWQINGPGAPDGGRSYSGTRSLYMGIYGASPDENTTPLANLEGVGMGSPINLGWDRVCEETRTVNCSDDGDCVDSCVANACSLSGEPCLGPADCPDQLCRGARPELSFKHQISMVDSRNTSSPPDLSVGRGVVQIQLADGDGDPAGPWQRLEPYFNVYDQQNSDNFTNCMFDPTDDGNTEDDFFDPTDPDRRFGPSSTCFPSFTFTYLGDTDTTFTESLIGNASDGPGLQGATGLGTWVESRFNLERFRGRRARLRFVTSDIKAGAATSHEAIFMWNPLPTDDGWWIDDVTVLDTLTTPATVSNDDADNSDLPECGVACNTVLASLVATPSTDYPGRRIELDASGSLADRCLDGALEFRFWRDGNGNGAGEDPTDTLLRSWTLNPGIPVAPLISACYVVDVRCSSDAACSDMSRAAATITCSSVDGGPFPEEILALDPTTFAWTTPLDTTYVYGDLDQVSTYATLGGSPLGPTDSFAFSTTPAPGAGYWLLVTQRGDTCAAEGSWQTGEGAEPGRDEKVAGVVCPSD